MLNKPKEKRGARRAARDVSHDFDKDIWKPGTLLCPVPAVMLTCADEDGHANIITVAWAGTVCSEPPMLSVSIREERHSYGLITKTGQFVVNIPSVDQVRAMDYCGVVSGRDIDKFAETGLTPTPAAQVRPPLIAECPINIECEVRQTLNLGSHAMFVAEILQVHVNHRMVTASGRFALEQARLAAFAHGGYYALGKKIGFFGYSVQKKTKKDA